MLKQITIMPNKKFMFDFLATINFNKIDDCILIGSDILKDLPKWERFKEIKDLWFMVVPRGDEIPEGIEELKHYKLLPSINRGMSSTQIRNIISCKGADKEPLKQELYDCDNVIKYYTRKE